MTLLSETMLDAEGNSFSSMKDLAGFRLIICVEPLDLPYTP